MATLLTRSVAVILEAGIGDVPRMICPQCRSSDCYRSHRNGFADFLGTMGGLRPWRCHTCDYRFHAGSVAVRFMGYAHCWRCGNFDLDRVASDRVDRGAFNFLKRLLSLPAYRCDPCREKFFSIRPYRRIMPSITTVSEHTGSR